MNLLISYILGGAYFIFAVIITFFIPGNLFLRKIKLPLSLVITASLVLGMSMWTLLAFLLGHIGMRNLSYFYLFISSAIFMLINYKKINFSLKKKNRLDKKDLLILIILVIGISTQLLATVFNAIPVKNGLFFCCGGADTLYHAALVKELLNNFPPNEPAIFNEALKNYHFLSNLLISDLIRIFKLPLLATEFNFFPILMSILFGLTGYSLAKSFNLGKNFIILFLLLLFFFSDIFYILTLITSGKFIFNVATIETSLSLWVSYSRFFGIVFFLQALTFLTIWIKEKNNKFLLPIIITSAILIGIKVYIGILFLTGLGFLILYQFIKKDFKNSLLLASSFFLSALIYLSVNSSSGGLIFTGFWRVRDFIVTPALNLSNLELARIIFEENGNIKRHLFDLLYFSIYVIFSFGILITSFLNSIKNLRRIPIELHIFLISSFITTFILGMFFIQKTGGANSSQFLISIYLIGTIYSALFLDYLISKKHIFFNLIVFCLILVTIPKTISIILSDTRKLQNNIYIIFNNEALKSYEYINTSLPTNSIFLLDPGLNNYCLGLVIFTKSKPYYCAAGAPGDRGINTKNYEDYVSTIVGDKKMVENPKYNFLVVSNDTKEIENYKILYKNNKYKILKHE